MERREDEKFEDYKKRRKEEKVKTKQKLKGRPIWLSKMEGPADSLILHKRSQEIDAKINKVKEEVLNGKKA